MTPFDASGLVQAISPVPTMFSTLSKREIIIFVTFNSSSANAFNLDQSKILSSGNGLTLYHTILMFNDPGKEAF